MVTRDPGPFLPKPSLSTQLPGSPTEPACSSWTSPVWVRLGKPPTAGPVTEVVLMGKVRSTGVG